MNFVNVILQNSAIKEAKLYPAAKRAAENPSLGITIQNEAAYHVIRDCANITQLYLPHFVFSSYQEPFKTLYQKFKKEDIIEFIDACKTNLVLNQLFEIILYKAQQLNNATLSAEANKNASISMSNDPYGDYALYLEDTAPLPNVKTSSTSLEILCQAFGL